MFVVYSQMIQKKYVCITYVCMCACIVCADKENNKTNAINCKYQGIWVKI